MKKGCLFFVVGLLILGLTLKLLAVMAPILVILSGVGVWMYSSKSPNPKMRNISFITLIGSIIVSILFTPLLFKDSREENNINSSTTSTSTIVSTTSESKRESSTDSTKDSDATTNTVESVADNRTENSEPDKPVVPETSESTEPVEQETSEPTEPVVQESVESAEIHQPETTEPVTQDRIVYVARNGEADVYWYDMNNMPKQTNFNNVVQMTEQEAINLQKRHTTKE